MFKYLKAKTGKCEDCKHIVELDDMQSIESNYGHLLFCPEHKKKYDRLFVSENPMYSFINATSYMKARYARLKESKNK